MGEESTGPGPRNAVRRRLRDLPGDALDGANNAVVDVPSGMATAAHGGLDGQHRTEQCGTGRA
ncbi:hypothetical protein [Blastococcus sp. SYSU DS1024]